MTVEISELTLEAIDGARHLGPSEDVVAAVRFAARAGHDTQTCYRFVSALVMTDALGKAAAWDGILARVVRLEGKG